MKNIILVILLISINLFAANTLTYIVDSNGHKRNLNSKKDNMEIIISNNISRKSIQSQSILKCNEQIKILSNDQFLYIQSDSFGPGPMEIIVEDKNKTVLLKLTSTKTHFKINLKKIKNISIIKVYNFFADMQYCKNVIYER